MKKSERIVFIWLPLVAVSIGLFWNDVYLMLFSIFILIWHHIYEYN
jgi:hypothetical protein